MPNGYHGKILHIDLTAGTLEIEEPDEGFYRDNRNIGLRAKKRLNELGVDLGDSLNEKIEKARTSKLDTLLED